MSTPTLAGVMVYSKHRIVRPIFDYLEMRKEVSILSSVFQNCPHCQWIIYFQVSNNSDLNKYFFK